MAGRSVIVHGPQGCGKSRHAQALCRHFDMDQIVELEDHPPGEEVPAFGALILTNKDPATIEAPSYRMIAFADALSEIDEARIAASAAPTILRAAAEAIDARAALRDCPQGERSMGRCVAAFNAITGHQLTEVEGWHFMELLKLARATAGGHHLDDHTDRAAYAALAGEAAERRQVPA